VIIVVYSILEVLGIYITDIPKEALKTVNTEMLVVVFRTIMYSSVWYMYLNKSKRVKAIYK
jgi:hypothetical protein